MLQSNTLSFLKDLKRNNNRDWFQQNRSAYEAAKKDFLLLTTQLIEGMGKIDRHIQEADLDPKKCMPRINRDIRFSKDKSPYKTNFFCFISQGGRKSPFAGYYFQLEPGNSFAGGGVYMPATPQLTAFRKAIQSDPQQWKSIVESPVFNNVFPEGVQALQTLSRPPKGFSKEDPVLSYLKMKGYYTTHFLENAALQKEDAILKILAGMKAVMPMIRFLNKSVGVEFEG